MKEKIKTNFKFTNKAINKINNITRKSKYKNFRIRIVSGGCAGLQYKFSIDNSLNDSDIIINDKESNIKLVIDNNSLRYINAGLIDYTDDINGSRFIIKNPNIINLCNCGLSFKTNNRYSNNK